VTCALSARLQAQERRVKRSQLPPAVQKTVTEQSAGATIRGYSREVENGQTEYEVELTLQGHSKDVSIAPDGSVLEIEEPGPPGSAESNRLRSTAHSWRTKPTCAPARTAQRSRSARTASGSRIRNDGQI
jgi:hypothetical protein